MKNLYLNSKIVLLVCMFQIACFGGEEKNTNYGLPHFDGNGNQKLPLASGSGANKNIDWSHGTIDNINWYYSEYHGLLGKAKLQHVSFTNGFAEFSPSGDICGIIAGIKPTMDNCEVDWSWMINNPTINKNQDNTYNTPLSVGFIFSFQKFNKVIINNASDYLPLCIEYVSVPKSIENVNVGGKYLIDGFNIYTVGKVINVTKEGTWTHVENIHPMDDLIDLFTCGKLEEEFKGIKDHFNCQGKNKDDKLLEKDNLKMIGVFIYSDDYTKGNNGKPNGQMTSSIKELKISQKSN